MVSPVAQRAALRDGLLAAGFSMRWTRRPRRRRGDDPYGLAMLAARWRGRVDGILLVAPRHLPPARACPAAVIGGVAVASVHADRSAQLVPWLAALPTAGDGGGWAVLAAGQHHYLRLSCALAARLRRPSGAAAVASGRRRAVARWSGDRVARATLRDRLVTRPALVLYTGHGLPAGLPAFGGVTATDWGAAGRASGNVALFACRTLAWIGSRPGFAWRLVASGRAAGVLAAVVDVDRRLNSAFARRCADHLAAYGGDLAAALVALDRELTAQSPLRAVLMAYRLVGLVNRRADPATTLAAGSSARG